MHTIEKFNYIVTLPKFHNFIITELFGQKPEYFQQNMRC